MAHSPHGSESEQSDVTDGLNKKQALTANDENESYRGSKHAFTQTSSVKHVLPGSDNEKTEDAVDSLQKVQKWLLDAPVFPFRVNSDSQHEHKIVTKDVIVKPERFHMDLETFIVESSSECTLDINIKCKKESCTNVNVTKKSSRPSKDIASRLPPQDKDITSVNVAANRMPLCEPSPNDSEDSVFLLWSSFDDDKKIQSSKKEKERCIVLDKGHVPSKTLHFEDPIAKDFKEGMQQLSTSFGRKFGKTLKPIGAPVPPTTSRISDSPAPTRQELQQKLLTEVKTKKAIAFNKSKEIEKMDEEIQVLSDTETVDTENKLTYHKCESFCSNTSLPPLSDLNEGCESGSTTGSVKLYRNKSSRKKLITEGFDLFNHFQRSLLASNDQKNGSAIKDWSEVSKLGPENCTEPDKNDVEGKYIVQITRSPENSHHDDVKLNDSTSNFEDNGFESQGIDKFCSGQFHETSLTAWSPGRNKITVNDGEVDDGRFSGTSECQDYSKSASNEIVKTGFNDEAELSGEYKSGDEDKKECDDAELSGENKSEDEDDEQSSEDTSVDEEESGEDTSVDEEESGEAEQSGEDKSGDEGEKEDEKFIENNDCLAVNEDGIPADNVLQEKIAPLHIVKEFFNEEAELSGEDESSDEDEEDEEFIENNDCLAVNEEDGIPADDVLRGEIAPLHIKHMEAHDNEQLNMMKEKFLKDGILHADSGGRQKKYTWKTQDENFKNPSNSDSDSEDEPENSEFESGDKTKWRQECLIDLVSDDEDAKYSSVKQELNLNIMGKSSPDEQTNKAATFKRKRGSLLTINEDDCSNVLKKLKMSGEPSGSITTKHYVFTNQGELRETASVSRNTSSGNFSALNEHIN